MTAKLLGFSDISPNSLDAVSDRDFLVEYVSACALVLHLHVSQLAEEWIYWACDRVFVYHIGLGVFHRLKHCRNKEKPRYAGDNTRQVRQDYKAT